MAELSDHVFPASVWKAFWERVEEDGEEEESEEKGEWPSMAKPLGHAWPCVPPAVVETLRGMRGGGSGG